MGIYFRNDSQFWWMHIEGTRIRRSTGIPRDGGSPVGDKELEAQAQRVYATTKAKHTLGVLVPTKPVISFRDHAQWYETNVSAHFRGASKTRSMLKTLRLAFGHVDNLALLNGKMVQEWMSARKRQGVAPATINRELDVLKAMLRRAMPTYLETWPLGEVRRLWIPEAEPRVLTPEEEAKILRVATDEEAALVIMAIDTLLRLSSCLELKWPQVKATVIVPLNAKVQHDVVPITRRLKDALGKLHRDTGYVFGWLYRGRGPTSAKNAAIRLFDDLCQRANIPHGRQAHGVTFHCLRHTGATRALQKGASVRTVMKLGGWKSERMVMRYTHATDADVRMAAESIGPAPALKFKKKA